MYLSDELSFIENTTNKNGHSNRYGVMYVITAVYVVMHVTCIRLTSRIRLYDIHLLFFPLGINCAFYVV
jgi:hypothetical protein